MPARRPETEIVPFPLPGGSQSADQLVKYLADPHRYAQAYQQLIGLGAEASEAARGGLRHENPQVRMHCCRVLDHVMDPDSIPALIAALGDPDAEVRVQALHALACDRCKKDSCRPAAGTVLPAALMMLRGDGSARVRAMAAELAGAWAPTHPEAAAALQASAEADPSPVVRKKAAWYTPGGTIYRRKVAGATMTHGAPGRAVTV
jgi:HEAT repeat protein